MIKKVLMGLALIEAFQQVIELDERHQVFAQARNHADSVGKPLLVVGTPKWRFTHPCGDITIDISPDRGEYCNTEIADVRAIPYPNQYFGAAFISHVLEHLPTISDAYKALDELHRVADKVFIVSPHKTSLAAWLHPDHHLWITADDGGYIIEQRDKGNIE